LFMMERDSSVHLVFGGKQKSVPVSTSSK